MLPGCDGATGPQGVNRRAALCSLEGCKTTPPGIMQYLSGLTDDPLGQIHPEVSLDTDPLRPSLIKGACSISIPPPEN